MDGTAIRGGGHEQQQLAEHWRQSRLIMGGTAIMSAAAMNAARVVSAAAMNNSSLLAENWRQ